MLSLALPGGSEWLLIGAIACLYIYAFVTLYRNIITRPDMHVNTKLGWTIFFVFAPIIALIIFKLFGRNQMA
ncbi:MAG: PLDc N-terminal domain-containing protein [Chitinophagaceae bacterium]|jgi:hypothetical protein|nr:PLDc N-terminal domain-containing protein [Chitinophagaceae bacterium]